MIFYTDYFGRYYKLTGSGLSITKWDIVTGLFLPEILPSGMNSLNCTKTPQYQKINQGMTWKNLNGFSFWEYAHRLWARVWALFLIPLVFWVKGFLIRALKTDLFIVFFHFIRYCRHFGWIMVASGLVNRQLGECI